MKKLLCGFIVFVALANPARAVTCAEGILVIDQMSKTLDLSDLERSNIEALLTKAKIEEEQLHERKCKIILADAIRFFLIKSVID
jgi:hypothetical protein